MLDANMLDDVRHLRFCEIDLTDDVLESSSLQTFHHELVRKKGRKKGRRENPTIRTMKPKGKFEGRKGGKTNPSFSGEIVCFQDGDDVWMLTLSETENLFFIPLFVFVGSVRHDFDRDLGLIEGQRDDKEEDLMKREREETFFSLLRAKKTRAKPPVPDLS